MKCTYINLEEATERRSHVEENFRKFGADGWTLERFDALDTAYVEKNGVKGSRRAGEKACFLSHQAIIANNAGATSPILIMEDDAVWGDSTCVTIDNFLRVSDRYDWDIIFTDVCVPSIDDMIRLVALRHELSGSQEVKLLDLSEMTFAGSTSYIVNHHSLGKLAACLASHTELDMPYDLFLRQMIWEKKLKGLMFFPFVTSLSNLSSTSQIQQANSTDAIWDVFRKMVWVGRDFDAVAPTLEMINRDMCDDESRLFGIVFAALLSKSFKTK